MSRRNEFILWGSIFICSVGIIVFVYFIVKRATRERHTCGTGECLTNIITGEKECSGVLTEDLFNKCNPPRRCRQGYLMYNSEIGSARSCPEEYSDDECKCYAYEFCPEEITTYFLEEPISYYGRPVDSQTTASRFLFSMHNSYTHVILPTVEIRSRPLAINIGDVKGSCSIASYNIDLVRPVAGYRNLNRCLTGRLVLRDNRYICKRDPLIDQMECEEPKRIIETNGSYVCELPPYLG